ncbi:MAG: endolytic transglycosylase MltG [Paludibacteraceae bacterium]
MRKLQSSKAGKIIIPIVLAVTCVFIYAAYLFLMPNMTSKTGKDTYLYLRENSSFNDVIEQLQQKANVKSISSLKAAVAYLKFVNIKPGRYKIEKRMNNLSLVRNLKNGRQNPVNLTFNNIRTKEELAGRLSKELMPDSTQILSLLNDSAFLAGYKLNPYTSISVFLPNTYQIYWTTNAQKLFERMYREYEKFWSDERKQKAAVIPLTQTEVITLASIVESETNNIKEQPIVAGLYINRLKKNMALQADPTVIFAVGDFTIKRVTGKYTGIDSPYNTYKNRGLPPGPIRIPSLAALDAVLNYDKNDYIYMSAKETLNGEHNFASTWAEHTVNAAKYQHALNELGIK